LRNGRTATRTREQDEYGVPRIPVGIVALKVTAAEGIALALPINYAQASVAIDTASSGESQGFAAMVARAKADQSGVGQLRATSVPSQPLPMLVGLSKDRFGRVSALVVLPASSWPQFRRLSFEVLAGQQVLCSFDSETTNWSRLERNAHLGHIHPDQLTRILKRSTNGTLYLGEAPLVPRGCPETQLHWTSQLRLVGADAEFSALQ
jgi:hypothetical protein